ncbi:cysteine desulfurase family protein [Pseudoroseomonas globiformis]|uniref:Cysteine desulfurase n=1 Tax=Teichococcus globiformis TaxID=2307229 RepID=A0ABV7G270_9PROT
MNNRLYLDANATEPLLPEARNAAMEAMELLGNPSSVHAAGRAARRLLEACRSAVAEAARSRPEDVIFTSGATEANAIAIHGIGRGRRILAGATEHPSVRQAAPEALIVPVLDDGRIDLEALEALLAEGPPSMLCLMAANNETGILHPVQEAAELCHRFGALIHVDAVQLPGRMPFALPGLRADSLVLSAHKAGGPKGAGALIIRPHLEVRPLMGGGGQERGRRGGTEPLPAIAGFAAALAHADPDRALRLTLLRNRIEELTGAVVIGRGVERLPNTSCLLLPDVPAETQVIALDLAGVAVSAGAACSSGKVAESPVLRAMGLERQAGCAIRVSLPWNAPEDAADRFAQAYAAVRQRIQARRVTINHG